MGPVVGRTEDELSGVNCLWSQLVVRIPKIVGLGGKRGAGVPGCGVPGCGKRGVWWKRRGPVE